MTKEEKMKTMQAWQERLSACRAAISIMMLDGAGAPEQGRAYRNRMRAVLMGEQHRILTEPGMPECLSSLLEETGPEEDAHREAELYCKMIRDNRAVPPAKKMALEAALDVTRAAWPEAKRTGEYASFAPALQEVIDRAREIASFREGGSIYDRLLDGNQAGWTTAEYDRFFDAVRARVLPLLKKIMEAEAPETDFLHAQAPVATQREVMQKVRAYLGVTDAWNRMGEGEHPLTSFVCRGDVRFTTKYREYDAAQGVLSTVHESGHAWFAHNVDPRYEGSIIGGSISAGLHESQSRLCENHLARTAPFWEAVLPLYQEAFPGAFDGITPERFVRGLNAVRPSLIRTEADEVTYPIHIMIRYELEKELFDGKMKAADLSEAWNEKYRQYLGVVPGNAGEGVLQDMHWPYAYFGYFPTYALGSAMAAQFARKMREDLDVDAALREGRYPELMQYLGERVHRYANRYPAEELVARATGEPFDVKYYVSYLEEKYGRLYGLVQ